MRQIPFRQSIYYPFHSIKFPHSPAKAIGHPATAETAEHAANGKDGDSHRVELLYELLTNVLAIAILVHILHKVLDILFGRINHSSIVTKLQHAQHSREYRVGKKEGKTLQESWRQRETRDGQRLVKDSCSSLCGQETGSFGLGLCGFIKRFANECAPEIKLY